MPLYSGLRFTATSSTLLAWAAEQHAGLAELLGLSGQSVTQTGSRKVSSTTLPRRLASETGWPC